MNQNMGENNALQELKGLFEDSHTVLARITPTERNMLRFPSKLIFFGFFDTAH